MDDFELEIKKEFINEALINLEDAEGAFMELETASDKKPLLDKIFRLAHNLKGGARAVGFGDVAEFTHQFENLVQGIQKDKIFLTSDVVSTLLKCNDRLVEMLTALKADLSATSNNNDLIQEIKSCISGESISLSVPNASNFNIDNDQAPQPQSAQASVGTQATSAAGKDRAPSSRDKDDEIVRVSLSRIDQLNDYVGELIVLQSVISQQALASTTAGGQSVIRQMMKLSKDIQSLSMSLRMLPVKPLVQKLQRVVRDTAKALNKQVQFEVYGEQIDVDKSVLDRLADPLIHILRNAIDHGLEATEDRITNGKSQSGRVTLTFINDGNHLNVEIRDDGRGINGQILKKKAIEKGLLTESQILSEKQLVNLIFHPGFSTKSETSEISGRGVGMDVVKTNVESAGGHVEVSTEVGAGTLFKLQIPLSLAVIEGMVICSNQSRYVIPLAQVQETVNLKNYKIHKDKLAVGHCIDLRGVVVPLFGVDHVLKNQASAKDVSGDDIAMIFSVRDQLIGLVVKDILHTQQIVIKPLTNGIHTQRGWIGSCVLGDGLPTLIISPVDLLEGRVLHSQSGHDIKGVA